MPGSIGQGKLKGVNQKHDLFRNGAVRERHGPPPGGAVRLSRKNNELIRKSSLLLDNTWREGNYHPDSRRMGNRHDPDKRPPA
jgi:hypothetical protein